MKTLKRFAAVLAMTLVVLGVAPTAMAAAPGVDSNRNDALCTSLYLGRFGNHTICIPLP